MIWIGIDYQLFLTFFFLGEYPEGGWVWSFGGKGVFLRWGWRRGKDSVVRDFRTIAFDGKLYFLMNE